VDKKVQAGVPSWAPVPPADDGPYLEVMWPRIKRPVAGYLLDARPQGAFCHWLPDQRPGAKPTDGRTTCCVGRENNCRYCNPAFGRKWVGYAAYLDSVVGRIKLAQITKEAVVSCPSLADPRRNLRGAFLRLERLGELNNGRVQAEMIFSAEATRLPRAPDIVPTLVKMWGLVPIMTPLHELAKGVLNA
jgi:hypothetical protein